MVRCLEIYVNGRRLCRAGVGPTGVVSANVNWVGGASASKDKARRTVKGKAELCVGGFYRQESGADVVPEWVSRVLRPGDEVSIRFLDASTVDPPRRQVVRSQDE